MKEDESVSASENQSVAAASSALARSASVQNDRPRSEPLALVPPFPPPASFRTMPLQVLTRANTHLRMVKQGIRDMEDPDQDRVLLGFFGIAVFGRSVTLALQHLRTFDDHAFDEWYKPWFGEMRTDELCRFFYQLRTDILHDMNPLVGFVWRPMARTPQVSEQLPSPIDRLPRCTEVGVLKTPLWFTFVACTSHT
jgi:hypothetical protein